MKEQYKSTELGKIKPGINLGDADMPEIVVELYDKGSIAGISTASYGSSRVPYITTYIFQKRKNQIYKVTQANERPIINGESKVLDQLLTKDDRMTEEVLCKLILDIAKIPKPWSTH